MAVDNLPCELPKDASEDFGSEFVNFVAKHLIEGDDEGILKRATICENGDLPTPLSICVTMRMVNWLKSKSPQAIHQFQKVKSSVVA